MVESRVVGEYDFQSEFPRRIGRCFMGDPDLFEFYAMDESHFRMYRSVQQMVVLASLTSASVASCNVGLQTTSSAFFPEP